MLTQTLPAPAEIHVTSIGLAAGFFNGIRPFGSPVRGLKRIIVPLGTSWRQSDPNPTATTPSTGF